ncbi:MAG: FKBP-type peptidyl-prolyl cis-trans isomerase [Balneola sp.]
MKFRNSLFAFLFLFIVSCGGDDPFLFEDDFSTVPDAFSTSGVTPDTTESGLIIYELEVGSGEIEVGIRDAVSVYYTGRKTNSEVFDSSYKNGQTSPVSFTVVNLVDGFTEGLIGMKEGGKRVLVIPPSLGYEGSTSTLRNDTLVFDLELNAIAY